MEHLPFGRDHVREGEREIEAIVEPAAPGKARVEAAGGVTPDIGELAPGEVRGRRLVGNDHP